MVMLRKWSVFGERLLTSKDLCYLSTVTPMVITTVCILSREVYHKIAQVELQNDMISIGAIGRKLSDPGPGMRWDRQAEQHVRVPS